MTGPRLDRKTLDGVTQVRNYYFYPLETWTWLSADTGLPDIPEGYVWRVTRSEYTANLKVGLYQEVAYSATEGPLFRRKVVEKTKYVLVKDTVLGYRESIEPDGILRKALYVLWMVEDDNLALAARETAEKLIGIYPPRSVDK